MNYCTKCGSIYSQPGTCNCFARGTVIPSPLPIQPITPAPWAPTTPIINPPWWGTTIVWGNA